MRKLKQISLFIITSILFTFNVSAKEVHVWDKTPIEIKLQLNKERVIRFPSNIKLGMTPAFRNVITMSNAAGVLYIKPNSIFNKTRVFATLDNGEVLLLDLFSVDDGDQGNLGEFEIVHIKSIENKASKFNSGKSNTEVTYGSSRHTSNEITIKDLIQYAVIDLYGPKRLLPVLPSVVSSEIRKPLNLKHVFINRSAGLFDLEAFKQYRTMNYTITAINLRNRTAYPQDVVLTDVYPAMLVNSSYETYVEPRSNNKNNRDSTTFFIVTKKPLNEYSFYAMKSSKKMGDGELNE